MREDSMDLATSSFKILPSALMFPIRGKEKGWVQFSAASNH